MIFLLVVAGMVAAVQIISDDDLLADYGSEGCRQRLIAKV